MTTRLISRRWLIGSLSAMLIAALTPVTPILAHDADCPFCKLKVVQDTKEQDNEVVLRYGRKRIEYRCIYCALAEAQTDQYKGDLRILAPSEIKGKPVLIERSEGRWSVPGGAVFVGVKESHKHCATTYRAFTSKSAFDAHVKKFPELLKDARALTLDELAALAKGATPLKSTEAKVAQ